MCLAVPGKIIEIYDTAGMRMGKVDFGGVSAKPVSKQSRKPISALM